MTVLFRERCKVHRERLETHRQLQPQNIPTARTAPYPALPVAVQYHPFTLEWLFHVRPRGLGAGGSKNCGG